MNVLLVNFYKEDGNSVKKLQYQYTSSDCKHSISINNPETFEFTVSSGGDDEDDDDISEIDLNCILSLQQIKINRLRNLIIKNIDSATFSLRKLKDLLSQFGEVGEIKTIEDVTNNSRLICFVNFKDEKAASECLKFINTSSGHKDWFINYHIERLEREKLHFQDLKEDNSDILFKKVYIGLNANNKTSLSQPKNVASSRLSTQPNSEIKLILDPVAENNSHKKLNHFMGIKIYLALVELMKQNSANGPFTLQSFHYHQNYCILKLDTHKQATDLITLLDGLKLSVQESDFTLNLHRAIVNSNSTRRNSCSSRKNLAPSFSSSRRFSSCYQDQFSGKRFSDTSDTFGFPTPVHSPSFSPKTGSPISVETTLVGGNGAVSRLETTPPLPILPPFYCYPPASLQNNFNHPGSPNFIYSGYPSVQFPILIPYKDNGGTVLGASLPPPQYPNIPRQQTNIWPYPIPLSTQQHSNLYIQNLPLAWCDRDLENFITGYLKDSEHFEDPVKELISHKIITHNFTGANSEGFSKGYAFVSFTNPLVASKCMNDLNGYELPVEEYKKSRRNILNPDAETDEDRREQNHSQYSCRIKINFAMKRGKSLCAAKNEPLSFNKFFLESMDDQLGVS